MNPTDDVETIGLGHLEIDDREIGRRLLGLGERAPAVVCGDNLISRTRQPGSHLPTDHHVIVDYEYPNASWC